MTVTVCVEHDRFRVMETLGGWPDDHTLEKGFCPDCLMWVARVTFANGDVTERALSTMEISMLKLMEAGR